MNFLYLNLVAECGRIKCISLPTLFMRFQSITTGKLRDTMSYKERVRVEEEAGRLEKGTYDSVKKLNPYISIYDNKRYKVY